MGETILTIGITSYNRIKELERCLDSIKDDYQEGVEVLICEDNSPRKLEIEELVNNYINNNPRMNIVFHSNAENLGYDRNLKNIINLSKGKYIFFLSDDDRIYKDTLIDTLKCIRDNKPGMIYSPCYQTELSQYKRRYDSSFAIKQGVDYVTKHVYDSILFSGLVFKKEYVSGLDAEPFLNKNYFQVYMFLYSIMNYGGYYIDTVTVEAVGDGENGYGKSDSSVKNPLLANRNSVFSDLEFHKGLIWTIRKFDSDFETNVFKGFEREYNIRSYGGLSRANALGKDIYSKYWAMLKTLDLRISLVTRLYHFLLTVFGAKIMDKVIQIPRNLLLRKRHLNE